MTRQEMVPRIEVIGEKLLVLPKGKIIFKMMKGKEQPYLQWSEEGKTMTKYVKVGERNEIFQKIEHREELLKELAELKKGLQERTDSRIELTCKTNVVYGQALEDLIGGVENYERRDCYGKLQRYLKSGSRGKVCILYGLRRTGKTTLLFQLLGDLPAEERIKAVYIKLRMTDALADLDVDLRMLSSRGYQYAFLDEVTLMEDLWIVHRSFRISMRCRG